MLKARPFATIVLISMTLLSCGEAEIDQKYWLQQGQQTLQPFKQQLMTALKSGMQQGPDKAIDTCRFEAPKIVAGLNNSEFELGRTSHKLRNPANAPQSWIKPFLDEYQQQPDNTAAHVVPLENGKVGYVEPIYIKPMCLSCHGEHVSQYVAERLTQAYPNDQARGFQDGDFRGVFWVAFNPEKSTSR